MISHAQPRSGDTPVQFTGDPAYRAFFADPWVSILDSLETNRCRLVGGGQHPTRVQRVRERLVYGTVEGTPLTSLPIPLALLPAAVLLLFQADIPSNVPNYLRCPHRLFPPLRATAGCEPVWLAPLLAWINEFREMRIVCGRRGPSEFDIICGIVRCFPAAQIAIISERREACTAIARMLQQQRSDVVVISGGGILPESHRVVVGTLFSGFSTQDFERRDVVVYLDARHAIGERGRFVTQCAARARLIGLQREADHFSDWELDWLTAIFGFRTLHLPLAESVRSSLDREENPLIMQERVQRFLDRRPGDRRGE